MFYWIQAKFVFRNLLFQFNSFPKIPQNIFIYYFLDDCTIFNLDIDLFLLKC